MEKIRLQKALAQAGIASRRASEQLIAQGRVQVNGQTVTEMGIKVDPERDRIAVDGRPVQAEHKRRYLLLHKPTGYLSVLHDDRGRPALIDLVPEAEGLHPVGRLDLDSEGLILLTDDGALTQHLTHPRYEHDKEYHVLVRGDVSYAVLRALRTGIELEDGKTSPARVDRLDRSPWGGGVRGETWLRLVLHEGHKRQIRRMCEVVRLYVVKLVRVRIGPLTLEGLPPGAYRPLTRDELTALRQVQRQTTDDRAQSARRRSRGRV
ncbi:MAG: rRNA pseudouridine synthase [Anaerolineae bacterium]|nr:rRNA pseudouridine synthase [Anaerolineae bacterium]